MRFVQVECAESVLTAALRMAGGGSYSVAWQPQRRVDREQVCALDGT